MLDNHRRKAVAAVRDFSHRASVAPAWLLSYPVTLTKPPRLLSDRADLIGWEAAMAGALMSYWFDPVGPGCTSGIIHRPDPEGRQSGRSPRSIPNEILSLIINLKTVKTLGLTIPAKILARARRSH